MASSPHRSLRPRRLFGLYLLVELAAVIGLIYAIGFGWTVLTLIGAFGLGLVLAGSQMTRQIARLRSGLATPQGAVSDGVMIALGTLLVVVPGIVSSVLGLLLLLPPTRAVLRPVVTAVAAKRLLTVPVVVTSTGMRAPARGQYVDGEVIDVTDVTVTDVTVTDVTDVTVTDVTDVTDTADVTDALPPAPPRPLS